MKPLSTEELTNLILSVFSPQKTDKCLAIIIDVPDEKISDNERWSQRRELAVDWYNKLNSAKSELNIDKINLLYYQNVHNNNADLPKTAYFFDGDYKNLNASTLSIQGKAVDFENELSHISGTLKFY